MLFPAQLVLPAAVHPCSANTDVRWSAGASRLQMYRQHWSAASIAPRARWDQACDTGVRLTLATGMSRDLQTCCRLIKPLSIPGS
jgi:hypothetical protein